MLILLLFVAQDPMRSPEPELYRAQMAAAESALRLGELTVARGWLDETAPAWRGFEWRLHDARLDESATVFKDGAGDVTALDVSPDGALQAWGHGDGAVELRGAADGALIARLGQHAAAVSFVRFDPAGRRVVSASHDRTVKIWDCETRALAVDFRGHGFPVGGAAFSPDGTLVGSCSYERPDGGVIGTLHLWNAADGSLVRTMNGGRKPLVGVEFSPDGRSIAAGSWAFCAFVWEVASGEPRAFPIPDEGIYNAVDSVSWCADGSLLAASSRDRTARVWRSADGELVATLRGHAGEVQRVAFAPDGAQIATASSDGTVKLWSSSGSLLATLQGHGAAVADLRFAKDGRSLVTSSLDGSVRTWDADASRYGGARLQASGAAYAARWSPDGQRIATASYDGRIALWDGESLAPLTSWQAHPPGTSCHALGWTADGQSLVSGSWERFVRVWDAGTGSERAAFEQDAGTADLAVSPDGRYAAACSGKTVCVYDLERLERTHVFGGHTAGVLAVQFSPDSRLCVSSGRDGRALIWKADTGALLQELAGPAPDVADAAFTPDGLQVVVAGSAGIVQLHDARTGERLRVLVQLRHGVNHLDVLPDGSRVALTSDALVLVDLAHGRDVAHLRPHAEHPYGLDFDAGGTRLLSCSSDGSVAVLDTRRLRDRPKPAPAAR